MRARLRLVSILAFFLMIGLALPLFASQAITATEARHHVGETATVCGRVAGTHYAASSRGRPTFLNLDRSYPHQIFTVVIWGADRAMFGRLERTYEGKDLCVTGKIKEFRGVPEIVASDPAQIRVRRSRNT